MYDILTLQPAEIPCQDVNSPYSYVNRLRY